jgi:hypothetical protein
MPDRTLLVWHRMPLGTDMAQDAIFWPMGALVLLTFIVLILIPIRRVRAGRAGQIVPDDFRYGESAKVPGHVALANRNYMNLLEMPVLFYVICLMLYVSGRVDATFLYLAWGYVALRAVHSLVHVSYNHVLHRLTVFTLSNFVIGAMWMLFFIRR